MSSLNCQYQIVSTSGTGPLSAQSQFKPALQTKDLTQNETIFVAGTETASQLFYNQVLSRQSDCLDQVVLFPDTVQQTESAEPLSNQAVSVSRGKYLLENLSQRRTGTSSTSVQSRTLDYALAKLSTQALEYPLTLQEFKNTLTQLSQRLSGMGHTGKPLTAQEVSQFNTTLKLFGLMTDGKNIYNLSVRGTSQTQTGVRMPTLCSQQEIEQLLDVCAALEDKLKSNKPASSSFEPASMKILTDSNTSVSSISQRFGAPAALPLIGSAQSFSDVMAQQILLQVQDRRRQYSDLLTQGEAFIEQSAELLDRLLPQQVEIDQALQQELEANQQLQTQAEQAAQSLNSLQELSSHLSSNSFQVSVEQLAGFNQSLTPFGLEIKRSSSGQVLYFQAGREVSLQDFKTALLRALSQQGTQLEQSRQDIVMSSQRVSELSTQSASLSQQIQTVNQTLATGLGLIEQASVLASQNREQLIALRHTPERWAQLSPEEQNQVLTLLTQTEEDLAHSDDLTVRGQDYLNRSQEQLEQSNVLREQSNRVLGSAHLLLNQLDAVLQDYRQALTRLCELWQEPFASHQLTQDLIHQANELESLLILAPGPDLSQLKQLTREWAERLEAIAQEFHQLQRDNVLETQSQRQYLEQSAGVLREQLAYHEHALDQISDQRREQLLKMLSDSLTAFKNNLA